MKNILIIGATGSIGIYLTDYLSSRNYKIFATGLKDRNNYYYKTKCIDYYSIDISRKEDFLKLPKVNFDCVVLLAGIMPARMKKYDPYQYININIIGPLNTLEYCRKNKIPKIIYALSHSDVYGHWNSGTFIKDNSHRIINLKGDHAVYIISKIAAADLIEHYHLEHGIQNITFRLPTVYCYWPDPTFYVDGEKREMAYLTFINKALKGEPIEIWGDPAKTKDIVYIKDFIQLVESAILSETASGIFNVGTGIPTTLEEQIRGVIEVFCNPGMISDIIYRPDKPSQTSYLYDISKAKAELGYVVKFPYIKMLEDMKSEMKSQIFNLIL